MKKEIRHKYVAALRGYKHALEMGKETECRMYWLGRINACGELLHRNTTKDIRRATYWL